jgi:hypothetical protein
MNNFKIAGVWYRVPGDPRLWWLVPRALLLFGVYLLLTWMANIIIVSGIVLVTTWVMLPAQHVENLKGPESVARLTDTQTQETRPLPRLEQAAIEAQPTALNERALTHVEPEHTTNSAKEPEICVFQSATVVAAMRCEPIPEQLSEQLQEWAEGVLKRKSLEGREQYPIEYQKVPRKES